MHSLRSRLIVLWLIALASCAAVSVLLLQLYRQSSAAQVGRAEAVVAHGCDLIRDRYQFYTAAWTGPVPALDDEPLRRDLTTAVTMALVRQEGVEGGLWQRDAGSLAYAYPTYEGSGPKKDLPTAESDSIRAANEAAAREQQVADRRVDLRSQTLLLHACPLGGPISGMTAWTMTRVPVAVGQGPLALGFGVLLVLMLALSALLLQLTAVWLRHVRRIETALGQERGVAIPQLARTGERELDRIIDALNDAGVRLAAARDEAQALSVRVAAAERLAALGRVAAGIAHEIRNPIAAMRLRAENALAGDDARRQKTLADMPEQIDRIDALASELLAMTQRREPQTVPIALEPFLAERVAAHYEQAADRGVTVTVDNTVQTVGIDPEMVGRILDNLLSNAIRHAPPGGCVEIRAKLRGCDVCLTVADSGTGIAPDLRGRLFEPFATGRADGTGLGLAIARELADAHGGSLTLLDSDVAGSGQGAVFALDLPGVADGEHPDRR